MSRLNGSTARHRGPLTLCVAFLLGSCGGGGGEGSSTGSPGPPVTQPPPAPPPPPSGPNRPPIVARPNSIQVAVHRHSFEYDASQGGTTFSDPDGDALRYEIKLGHTYNPHNDPNPPRGLRIEGTRVVGAPEELEAVIVTITASDRLGQTASNEFTIRVMPNSAPSVVSPNEDRLLSVGASLDIEATNGGATFRDPDGDSLTYEVTLRGEPRGLAVFGTRVSGVFDSIGLVEVTVTAKDAYDGIGNDVFLIAAPAPEPSPPTLPDPSYVYRDEALDLPFIFRLSSESVIPLWDTQPSGNRTTDAGATLGRVLFYDKRLSITNTVACSSCHRQSNGFAMPEKFGVGALGVPTKRNAMALANTRYNIHSAWFSDMRVRSLQELVLIPLQNPEELGSSLELVETKIRATDFYPPLFEAAFGTREITSERIARALSQFLQALISYRTKFDRAYNPMTNDPPDPTLVLNAQELRGFEIFGREGRGRCNLCHELRAHANEWQANNGLDEVPLDPGVQDLAMKQNSTAGVFRAASLRNIAVTGPYMHDGRFATLRDVINHYDHGVKDSRDLDSLLREGLHGPPIRLNLSEEDKDALEAFLRTLTDDEFLADPKFSDPFH